MPTFIETPTNYKNERMSGVGKYLNGRECRFLGPCWQLKGKSRSILKHILVQANQLIQLLIESNCQFSLTRRRR